MSAGPVYRFQRGEPIVIGREVVSGDPAGFTVTARMKKTTGQRVPDASTPVFATFAAQFEAAAPGRPARWVLSIPAQQTRQFEPGHYVADAAFLLGGEVVAVTEPAYILIVESVSG